MYRRTRLAWLFTVALLIGCGTKDSATDGDTGGSDAVVTPAAKEDDQSQPDTLETQSVASASKTKTAFATPLPAVFAEDLKYTPAYAYLVAVLRPGKMSELEGVKNLPGADFAGANSVKPSEIERVVATVYPRGDQRPHLAMGLVLQLRKDVDRKEIVSWLSPQAEPFQGDGRIYVDPEWDARNMVVGFPENRTILASSDPNFVFRGMQTAIAKDDAPHALAESFAKLDPDADAVAVVDVAKLQHFVYALLPEAADSLQEFLTPLKFARLMQASVNLSKPDGLVLRVENDDSKDSKQLGNAAKAVLQTHAESAIKGFRDALDEDYADQITSVQQRLNALLADTKVRHDGSSYTIQSGQLPKAAKSLKTVTDLGALHQARLRRRQTDLRFRHQMSLVGLAIHNYHDAYNQLPRDIVSNDGKPLLSWRVAILPFNEDSQLYERFHLDEPWNSEHNLQLLDKMPQTYLGRGSLETSKTPVQLVTGAGTGGEATTFEQLNGTSRTLAVVEAQQLVEWTRPADFAFDADDPRMGLRPDGSFGVMYDGWRVYIPGNADAAIVRTALMNDGGDLDVDLLRYEESGISIGESARDPLQLTDDRLGELFSKLGSDDEDEELDALRSLDGAQSKSIDPRTQSVLDKVTPFLSSKRPLTRSRALRTIRAWSAGGDVDWNAIAPLLEDRYEANRWLAIEVLSEFVEPELVRAMLRLPEQDYGVVRKVIYENYAGIAAEAALPLLKDSDAKMRVAACFLIGNTGDDYHLGDLEKMLDDENEDCRKAAKFAIDKLQEKGPLEAALEEFDGDMAAALEKVAKYVDIDGNENVIEVDLTHFDTPYRLKRREFRLLAKLTKLKILKLTYSSITAEGVAHLKDLPLEELNIAYCPSIDDEVAETLGNMATLRSLCLDETRIGDETAKAVGKLKSLQELDISSTRVSDAGLAYLGKLTQLETLNLSRTRISDQSLRAIAGHSKLRTLYLLDTGITDAGIPHLVTLKNLKFMNLSGSNVTEAGNVRLREALPSCEGLNLH